MGTGIIDGVPGAKGTLLRPWGPYQVEYPNPGLPGGDRRRGDRRRARQRHRRPQDRRGRAAGTHPCGHIKRPASAVYSSFLHCMHCIDYTIVFFIGVNRTATDIAVFKIETGALPAPIPIDTSTDLQANGIALPCSCNDSTLVYL